MSGGFPGPAGAAPSSRRRQPDVLEIVPDHRRPDAANAATDCVEGRPAVEEGVGRFIVEKPPQFAVELIAAGVIEHGARLLDELARPGILEEDVVRALLDLRGVPDLVRSLHPGRVSPAQRSGVELVLLHELYEV